jgi:5-methylthioadenosine/S-adenosylhomocysteine deaminase
LEVTAVDMIARGRYVITDARDGEGGVLTDGAILVRDGTIAEVGTYAAIRERHPAIDVVGDGTQLLMPGLIDAHSHGWGLSSIQQGVLYDFLENALVDWAYMRNIDPELSAALSAVRHLRNGCTTMHHNNWGESASRAEIADRTIAGYRHAGIRLAFSPGIRDENILALDDQAFFDTLPTELREFARPMVEYDKVAAVDAYLELFDDLRSRHDSAETRIILGPSWAHGATDEFVCRVKAKADEVGGVPVHFHTLQTPVQKAYGLRQYGKSVIAHYEDLGVLGPDFVFGHAVFVSESDIELLAARRASVTHHASCNLAIRNGIAPVRALLEGGVNVALGMDDKAINDDEDPIMELRLIHRLHRMSSFDLCQPALTAFEVLQVGTTNAARACGFGGEIGALSAGMRADAVLVDLGGILDDPWSSPDLGIAEMLIHRGRGSDVNTVIVGGVVVMQDRQFRTIDVERLYADVRKQAERGISEESRRYADQLSALKPYYQSYYASFAPELVPFYAVNSRT